MGIRANISDSGLVPAEQCREYDELVQRASEALSADLSEFAIRDAYRSGRTRSQEHLYYADGVKGRIDGLLNYLRSKVPSEVVERIGFRAP